MGIFCVHNVKTYQSPTWFPVLADCGRESSGDSSFEFGVLGFVDYAHPATAKFLKNLIV
jgi:hypothetical protein